MRRREFIRLFGCAAAWPLRLSAQQPAMPVIGWLSGRSPDAEAPIRVPFLKALEESGSRPGATLPLSTVSLEARKNVYRSLRPNSLANR